MWGRLSSLPGWVLFRKQLGMTSRGARDGFASDVFVKSALMEFATHPPKVSFIQLKILLAKIAGAL